MKQQILIVDDEVKIIEIVKAYLESSGYNVLTAINGVDALEILEKTHVDLLLLDLMLPYISGEEICLKVREKSNMPIIMMTAKVDETSIIDGLRMGADDYITKPFSPRQLVARVDAALRRAIPNELNQLLTIGEITLDLDNRTVTKNNQVIAVTPNEFKILKLLMERPNKVFTREEIIDLIMDNQFAGFDRTIDTHIKNLRQKVEEDPKNPSKILTIYGAGYRFHSEK